MLIKLSGKYPFGVLLDFIFRIMEVVLNYFLIISSSQNFGSWIMEVSDYGEDGQLFLCRSIRFLNFHSDSRGFRIMGVRIKEVMVY